MLCWSYHVFLSAVNPSTFAVISVFIKPDQWNIQVHIIIKASLKWKYPLPPQKKKAEWEWGNVSCSLLIYVESEWLILWNRGFQSVWPQQQGLLARHITSYIIYTMSWYPPFPIVKKKQKHCNHIGATSGLLYVFCGCVCMCENPAVFARLCVFRCVCV